MVWCGVTRLIIQFSKASIPPSVRSSTHPFLQIVLALNGEESLLPPGRDNPAGEGAPRHAHLPAQEYHGQD